MITLRESLTEEAVEQLIVSECLNSLEDVDTMNPRLMNALHTVIAYYSVPGEYEGGKYDAVL